jgi:phosphomannomutase
MSIKIDCFKAYDIRGRIPDQLNADVAYRVGNATAEYLQAKRIVIGRDIRHSSEELADAVIKGLIDAGVKVLDIGLGGTEMVYFATGHLEADGGIMVTASHNPADYNGLKLVRSESKPISGDTGLFDIQKIAERDERFFGESKGCHGHVDIGQLYRAKLLEFVDLNALKPLKIVVNAGNGGAGPTVDQLEPSLPFEFIKVHHEPDGSFPNGVPNPMLEENRQSTIDAINESGADFGIAWDGDFDRCFFFDENGRFIEGYYIVGLLAESLLKESPGSAIIYDPRLTWNTLETVSASGGRPVQSKSGHSFIKQVMREEDAVYGGEMSAHHYFRDFYYCDSGMIPWLLVAQLVSTTGKPLSTLVDDCMAKFPASGEINREVADVAAAIASISEKYEPNAETLDTTDGISMEFPEWRFNLRASNTEPVIRLNVESRANEALMRAKLGELLADLDRLA